MKKINWLLILLIGATSFVLSCKKKDKVNTCTLNEANFAGSYKIESIKYKLTPTSSEVDGTSFVDPCELDDVITFNAGNTYTYTDAGTACSPNGDDAGTWSLSGSSLTVDGTAAPVENFSCTGYSASQTDFNTTGDKIIITFKKQ
jgi:Lipocalin-like domain